MSAPSLAHFKIGVGAHLKTINKKEHNNNQYKAPIMENYIYIDLST